MKAIMSLGIYVHIPYCKQLCPYCDFSRYLIDKIMPPEKYVELLKLEISARALAVGPRSIQSLYFGGGTPSLFEPKLIVSVIEQLANHGFTLDKNAELTIEIDPGTIDERKLDALVLAGFTRFSVGAQSFNDRLLKLAGRKHSSIQTRALLTTMKKKQLTYSFDLLFSLPTQSLENLREDLLSVLDFDPSHLSAYLLNLAENHPMNVGRPNDDIQVAMFAEVERALLTKNILRYEISNFAKPGYESKHNLLYWRDQEYWGIGVSSHSYLKPSGTKSLWGERFSNPKRIQPYEAQIRSWQDSNAANSTWHFADGLAPEDFESLALHQSLTDFCHTGLRLVSGLSERSVVEKFSASIWAGVIVRLNSLVARGLIFSVDGTDRWALTDQGKLLANLVFEKLIFSKGELAL